MRKQMPNVRGRAVNMKMGVGSTATLAKGVELALPRPSLVAHARIFSLARTRSASDKSNRENMIRVTRVAAQYSRSTNSERVHHFYNVGYEIMA